MCLIRDQLLYEALVKLLNAKLLEVKKAIEIMEMNTKESNDRPEGLLTDVPQRAFSGYRLDHIAHCRCSGRTDYG